MASRSPIDISCLRDIGWKNWDPIGLLAEGATWKNAPFADEYDSYLLQVVSRLQSGVPKDEAVAYLNWVSSEQMGLGPVTDAAIQASVRTVEQIAEYLLHLPDSH